MSQEPDDGSTNSVAATAAATEAATAPAEQEVALPLAAHPSGPERPSVGSRIGRFLSGLSVRTKIAGTLVIILCLAVLSLGVTTFTRQNRLLRNEVKSRAAILAQQLANVGKEGLLTKEELPVVAAISDIMGRPDVVYAAVIDIDDRIFAHSDFSLKGKKPEDSGRREAAPAETAAFQETGNGIDTVLHASVPILLKSKSLRLGEARVGLSQRTLNESIAGQKRLYLWIACGFATGGLLVSLLLARMLTRPLDTLEEGIQIVAAGDLRQLVPVSTRDEIGRLTEAFNQMILNLREKLLMEKYLSQTTVLSIKEHRDVKQLKLGGERKYVTALFSDARGFTSLSEKMSPEEVVSLMNVYLNLQTTVIHHYGGIVDKFVGDEVMAIFEGRGREVNAVRAAVEIQSYCKALNAARAAAGEKTVSVGVGLNSGDVVMGNMGSEDHMDYTVIGDNINVAARLCGTAQPGQVLVSTATADEAGNDITWKQLQPVLVKGKDHPIGIAEALAAKGGARRFMRKETDVAVAYTLEGFSDEENSAVIRNISAGGCLLAVSGPLAIGSKLNVKLNLVLLGAITVRATVYHARKQDRTYYIGLCFESLHDDVRHRITRWVHQVNQEIGNGLFL